MQCKFKLSITVVFFVGYRHVRLLSNTGEAIDNCCLFVHIAITNKRGGGVSPVFIVVFVCLNYTTAMFNSYRFLQTLYFLIHVTQHLPVQMKDEENIP